MLVIPEIINLKLADMTFSQKHPGKKTAGTNLFQSAQFWKIESPKFQHTCGWKDLRLTNLLT